MCLHIRRRMVWLWNFVNRIRRYDNFFCKCFRLIELAGLLQSGHWSLKIHFANNLDLNTRHILHMLIHISTGNLISINLSISDPHHMWTEPIENFTIHSTLKCI